jgi:hypothetical protein
LFAVKVGAVATPLPLVAIALLTFVPVSAKVPLAPLAGAVNVTGTPLIGLPDSDTVASRSVAKAVPTVALCGVPAVAAIM